MHELAITQSVVDMVRDRTADRRVSTVRLQVGRLSAVEPEAMRFCFDLVVEGTVAAGARLDIDRRPAPRTAANATPTSCSTTPSCCARAAVPTSR